MAILKIRDSDGNIHEILAIKGNDYVLTDEDKQEIANMISGSGSIDLSKYALKTDIPDVSKYALKSEIPDVSAFQTESQVLELIRANMPTSGDEVSY